MKGYEKYIPFKPQPIEHRTWPDNLITHAPQWCSVDLRDGNQALIDPMNMEEKLEMFHMLVDEIGVKEVEIGFPPPPTPTMRSAASSSRAATSRMT